MEDIPRPQTDILGRPKQVTPTAASIRPLLMKASGLLQTVRSLMSTAPPVQGLSVHRLVSIADRLQQLQLASLRCVHQHLQVFFH